MSFWVRNKISEDFRKGLKQLVNSRNKIMFPKIFFLGNIEL